MKKRSYSLIILFITILFLSYLTKTSVSNGSTLTIKASDKFHYQLSKPNKKFHLPNKLNEISGLDYIGDNKLVCIEDENGSIFVFDMVKKKISKKIDFAKDRDYEGIEIVRKTAYVLRSNGDIYRVKKFGSKKQKVTKFKTFLDTGNDTEGLCYDEQNNRLLIACKGSPGKDKSLKGTKTIYGFDLEKKVLKKKPVFTISLESVEDYLLNGMIAKVYQKILEFFQPGNNITFQPSGISLHPITKNLYVISSVGKLIVVLDMNGKIITIQKLDSSIFKQPEGISFAENGDMYISNEYRGGKPNILKFRYDPN